MGKAGLDVPKFTGHGVAALVLFEVAEQYCDLLGGRLPSLESLEHLSSLKPALLRAEAWDNGWCSYEWTRSIVPGEDQRYAIQMVGAEDDKFRYFDTKAGWIGPDGSLLSFRVAVLQPPRTVKHKPASHGLEDLLAEPRKPRPQ